MKFGSMISWIDSSHVSPSFLFTDRFSATSIQYSAPFENSMTEVLTTGEHNSTGDCVESESQTPQSNAAS